jgi:hypothetical protein
MPRRAALARGPGESCGNRQADGEELHPHVSYFTSSWITRIFQRPRENNVASQARRRQQRNNRQIRPTDSSPPDCLAQRVEKEYVRRNLDSFVKLRLDLRRK